MSIMSILSKVPFKQSYIVETIKILPLFRELYVQKRYDREVAEADEINLRTLLRKQEDALHDKKAEIFTLRQKIKDLEENLDNCRYEINILNNANNNGR
tara:strand:- start:593 stop:889 length:297 start_codon:yes stop_codon:yes gene_type:complete